MLIRIILLFLLFGASSIGCIRRQEADSSTLHVVATTGMIADLVRSIGGEDVRVDQLIRSGIDPHLYRPVTDDVRAISQADIVFYNGLNLEGRMGSILASKRAKNKRVPVCEQIDLSLNSYGVDQTFPDPHCWMDVKLWIEVARVIETELCQMNPDRTASYQKRGSALRSELEVLHTEGTKLLGSIPDTQRVLVSSHDAFQYFGARYGIRVEGIQGISTSSEAGLKRVEQLVDLLVENRVPAVFVESSVPEKGVRSLIEGATQKGAVIRLGGELFTDSMGAEGDETGTYLGMMRHNFTTIARALGGVVD
jgi:manganese/zinc/iron transport system substrate-binding protein